MSLKWVTFDCYGTLIDWESGMREAFAPIASAHGLEANGKLSDRYIQYEMMVERHAYRPYREVLAEASTLLFQQEFKLTLSREEAGALAASLPTWKPFPDARPALERLRKRYRLAVLSNIDDDLLAASLRALGVEFEATITAEQVRSYKPVNTHWREALSRFNIEEEQLFHVGGSYLHDVMPAKQLGLRCAWINRKGEKAFSTSQPDATFPDLAPLPEYLGA